MAGVLIVLVGVFAVELQQWQKRRAIDKEINQLIAQEQNLQQKNQDLEQSLRYFSSDGYKEKLARQQLGLQKEGEIAVQFPKDIASAPQGNIPAKTPSNPEKWWNYLFLKHTN